MKAGTELGQLGGFRGYMMESHGLTHIMVLSIPLLVGECFAQNCWLHWSPPVRYPLSQACPSVPGCRTFQKWFAQDMIIKGKGKTFNISGCILSFYFPAGGKHAIFAFLSLNSSNFPCFNCRSSREAFALLSLSSYTIIPFQILCEP